MTTKRARCRRLITSNDCVEKHHKDSYNTATVIIDDLLVHVCSPHRSKNKRSSRWSAVLRSPETDCYGEWLFASTRLALHDSMLRAGWPSPWMEVKP